MTTTPPPEPPEPTPGPTPDRPADEPPPPPPPADSPQYPGAGAPQYPPPPSYPDQGGYDYGGYGAPPMQPRNGMGVAALVLGVIGFLIGPCSILAIIFGRIGLNRVARGEANNKGVAQAGFVLGIVTLVLWIIGMIALANR